ncbi:hypothetical protein L3X38_032206 [Prunus dulcis]|uniref:Uncharacterized protein n=1 Tax=Prunus dulcis TaxID=3755 RepID=A0AAD4VF16_PRUDU|nr:hypothetical protein L3X38_032206 [Prunus dulcis]
MFKAVEWGASEGAASVADFLHLLAKRKMCDEGGESGSFAQSSNVELCASRCGGDTCPLGLAAESFGRCLAPRKCVFLRHGRRRGCLGASHFDAGFARFIMV